MTAVRDTTVAARVPLDLRADLERIVDLERHANPDATLTTVIRRLLRVGADGVLGRTDVLAPLTGQPPAQAGGGTSRDAAVYTWPRAATGRMSVLKALARRGDHGATFDELIVELNAYSAQKRLHDLKRGGWAEPLTRDGEPVRRPTRTGALADVYVLTPAARRRMEGTA